MQSVVYDKVHNCNLSNEVGIGGNKDVNNRLAGRLPVVCFSLEIRPRVRGKTFQSKIDWDET